MPDETIEVPTQLFNRMCDHLLDLPYRETMQLYSDISDVLSELEDKPLIELH